MLMPHGGFYLFSMILDIVQVRISSAEAAHHLWPAESAADYVLLWLVHTASRTARLRLGSQLEARALARSAFARGRTGAGFRKK